jgi:hypothetical protein
MSSPRVKIIIPTYKRSKWLVDVFIDNIYNKLLKPLSEKLGHTITLVLYAQSFAEDEREEIERVLLDKKDLIDINYWDLPKETIMSYIRCESARYEIQKDPTITHILMMDDDLFIDGNKRVIGHFIKFLDLDSFRDQSAVFMAKPSMSFSVKPYKKNSIQRFKEREYLNLIRFQCFPSQALSGMLQQEWSKDLYKINDGEDTIIIALTYCYLYSKLKEEAGFLSIHGFDEILHLSRNAAYTVGVLSKSFREDNPGITEEEILRKESLVLSFIDKYDLRNTGFSFSDKVINGKIILRKLYPHIFRSNNSLDLSDKNIKSMIGYETVEEKETIKKEEPDIVLDKRERMRKHLESLKIKKGKPIRKKETVEVPRVNLEKTIRTPVKNVPLGRPPRNVINLPEVETLDRFSGPFPKGIHMCAVVPSYRREKWLKRYIPNLYLNILKPLNESMVGSLLTYRIYAQGCSDSDISDIKLMLEPFKEYIEVIFVREKEPEETITKLRLDYMKDAISNDASITHIMMADDDTYVFESNNVVEDFKILFGRVLSDDNSVYDIIPYNHNEPCLKIAPMSESINNLGLMWQMRFQILSRTSFESMVNAKWHSLDILESIPVSEDAIIILLCYISGGTYYNVFGFNSYIHIGVEDILKTRFDMDSSLVSKNIEKLRSIQEDFSFGTTGFNISGPREARNVVNKAVKRGVSIYHAYPAIFKKNRSNSLGTSMDTKNLCNESFKSSIRKGYIDIHRGYYTPVEIDNKIHVKFVVPSYKRDRWLFEFIPNMHDEVLKELNKQNIKVSMDIYVQNSENASDLKRFSRRYSQYVNILFVDKDDYGPEITRLRTSFIKTSIYKDATITHVINMDDDSYVDPSRKFSVVEDFKRLFRSPEFGEDFVGQVIPYNSGKNFVEKVDMTNGHSIWMARFQVYSKKILMRLFNSPWLDYEKLARIKVSDDIIIASLCMLEAEKGYYIHGFNDFSHIGVIDLIHKIYDVPEENKYEYDLIEKLKEFNFDNSGLNEGKAHHHDIKGAQYIGTDRHIYSSFKDLFINKDDEVFKDGEYNPYFPISLYLPPQRVKELKDSRAFISETKQNKKYAAISFFININEKFSPEFMDGVEVVRGIQQKYCEDNGIDYIRMDEEAYRVWETLNKGSKDLSIVSTSDYIRLFLIKEALKEYDVVCYLDSDHLLLEDCELLEYFDLTYRSGKISISQSKWFHDIDSYLMGNKDPMDYTQLRYISETDKGPYVDMSDINYDSTPIFYKNTPEHLNFIEKWEAYCEGILNSDTKSVEDNFILMGPDYVKSNVDIKDVNILTGQFLISVANEYQIIHNKSYCELFFKIQSKILKDCGNRPTGVNLSTVTRMTTWHSTIRKINEYYPVYALGNFDVSYKSVCWDKDEVYRVRDESEKIIKSKKMYSLLIEYSNPDYTVNTEESKDE